MTRDLFSGPCYGCFSPFLGCFAISLCFSCLACLKCLTSFKRFACLRCLVCLRWLSFNFIHTVSRLPFLLKGERERDPSRVILPSCSSGRDTATAYANYCGSVGFTALYHNESAKDFCLRIAFFFEMNFSHQLASDHGGRAILAP